MSENKNLAVVQTSRNTPMGRTTGGGLVFAPQNLSEAWELAKAMSSAQSGMPTHLQGDVGSCLSIIELAMNIRTSVFGLARHSMVVNNQLAFEAKVLHAAVIQNAPTEEQPRFRWEGEGDNRTCTVWATIKGEAEPREYETPHISKIRREKGSPLWKTDPDQQLAYYAARAFARREFPHILLGAYTREELEDANNRLDGAIDVTPPPPTKPATQSKLEAFAEAEVVEPEPIEEPVNAIEAINREMLNDHAMQAAEAGTDDFNEWLARTSVEERRLLDVIHLRKMAAEADAPEPEPTPEPTPKELAQNPSDPEPSEPKTAPEELGPKGKADDWLAIKIDTWTEPTDDDPMWGLIHPDTGSDQKMKKAWVKVEDGKIMLQRWITEQLKWPLEGGE